MHFVHLIQNRKRPAWAVFVALAIVGLLIAAFVLFSGISPEQFQVDDLYGVLD
jgi:hypothetical protein